MNYYRKPINKVIDNVKLKMQLGALILKMSENNNKIDDLLEADKNIKNNISNNTTKIENISSNLGIINTNKSNISSNLSKIGNNENNISSNLGMINTNKNDISSNLNQINDIKSILPTLEIFKKIYSIKNQSFKFNSNIIFFKLLEIEIENDSNVDGKLEINSNIYYTYDNLQKGYHCLQHEYQIFDDKNNLFHKTILNKTNSTDLDFDNNIMYAKDDFYIKFKNDYNKIKITLYLYRVYRYGAGVFNLELINENFINITYLDKNDISLKMEKNKSDISSNLGKIDTNKNDIKNNDADIAYNLRQVNIIKNNKSYLKNIYNILFYNKKTQIDIDNLFYEKVFDVNSKQNDFIEMDFKMLLEYEYMNEKVYIKSIYEIKGIDDHTLYTKTINHNTYAYFENKLFINENIFYNFIKSIEKIKFSIRFQLVNFFKVVKIWYIKNDNYRLILKHYSS